MPAWLFSLCQREQTASTEGQKKPSIPVHSQVPVGHFVAPRFAAAVSCVGVFWKSPRALAKMKMAIAGPVGAWGCIHAKRSPKAQNKGYCFLYKYKPKPLTYRKGLSKNGRTSASVRAVGMRALQQRHETHPTEERRLPTSPSAEALRELTAFSDEITTLLLDPRVGLALSIKKSGFLTCQGPNRCV